MTHFFRRGTLSYRDRNLSYTVLSAFLLAVFAAAGHSQTGSPTNSPDAAPSQSTAEQPAASTADTGPKPSIPYSATTSQAIPNQDSLPNTTSQPIPTDGPKQTTTTLDGTETKPIPSENAAPLATTPAPQEAPPSVPASVPTDGPSVVSAPLDAPISPLQKLDSTKAYAKPAAVDESAIGEEEVRQMLMGKPLFLRNGYLDNSLHFEDSGALDGKSAQGGYTLSAFDAEKVRLTKHYVEIVGVRYGLHFLGQLAYEDQATDRVRITPAKKRVVIRVDRMRVKIPKQPKAGKKGKKTEANPQEGAPVAELGPHETKSNKVANAQLRQALHKIFADGLDEQMMAAMPEFWRHYYEAAASKSDYKPKDPNVLHQNAVDSKAKLLSTFEPPSNEFAQSAGVAGLALYRVVVGANGRATDVAVSRPIGFGLDENAVDSIRKAQFEPARKDGKTVPVMLDLVVQFRIYSKRTSTVHAGQAELEAKGPILPGPYTLLHLQP